MRKPSMGKEEKEKGGKAFPACPHPAALPRLWLQYGLTPGRLLGTSSHHQGWWGQPGACFDGWGSWLSPPSTCTRPPFKLAVSLRGKKIQHCPSYPNPHVCCPCSAMTDLRAAANPIKEMSAGPTWGGLLCLPIPSCLASKFPV